MSRSPSRPGPMLLLAVIGSSSCAVVPIHPTAPVESIDPATLDARFALESASLSTDGALPISGSKDHEALRRYVAEQLDLAAGARDGASVALPTQAALEHTQQPAPRVEVLLIRLQTVLGDGTEVETEHRVRWMPPTTNGFTLLLAALSAAGPIGPLLSIPFLGLVAAAAAAVAATLGAVVLVVVFGQRALQVEAARTAAFSDGLQIALVAHARAVRGALSAGSNAMTALGQRSAQRIDSSAPRRQRRWPHRHRGSRWTSGARLPDLSNASSRYSCAIVRLMSLPPPSLTWPPT